MSPRVLFVAGIGVVVIGALASRTPAPVARVSAPRVVAAPIPPGPPPPPRWTFPIRHVDLPLPDASGIDLDGDGSPERWDTVPDSCGTGGCTYRIYLSRTGRFVGRLAGHDFFIAATKPGAAPEILAIWYLGNELEPTTYRFTHGHLVRRR